MFYKYWTLQEMIEYVNGSAVQPWNAPELSTILSTLGYTTTSYPIDLTKNEVKALWQSFFARYFDYYSLKKKATTPTEAENLNMTYTDVINWAVRFLNVLNNTYPYYSSLLKAYTDSAESLMANVKATSKSKTGFNDTPQNSNASDTYESDDYLTTFQKSLGETESELSPKIIRLKEIQDNYKRVMNDWLLEFDCLVLFVERGV